MSILLLLAEIIAVIAGFGVAAEVIAIGTEKLEPLIGQGMAGGVIIGLLGALPETMFVIIATLSGSFGVALGSALGGNIILFTLGIGIIGVVYSLKWKRPIAMKEDYRIEVYFLLASTLLLVLLLLYGTLDRISGGLLFLVYVAYLTYRYVNSRERIRAHAGTASGRRALANGSVYLIAGTAIIVAISGVFVNLITDFSLSIGISALWLALVVSPLAADLDENISAYRMVVRNAGGGSTAIVSFIGSKLQNNTMLLGLIGLLASGPVGLSGATTQFCAVIVVNLIAIGVIMRGKLTYLESGLLMIAYVAVIAATLAL